jgi:hypothetical protein
MCALLRTVLQKYPLYSHDTRCLFKKISADEVIVVSRMVCFRICVKNLTIIDTFAFVTMVG